MTVTTKYLFRKVFESKYVNNFIFLLKKFGIDKVTNIEFIINNKKFYIGENSQKIINMIKNKNTDEEIYNFISMIKENNASYGSDTKRGYKRAKDIFDIYNSLLCDKEKIDNYLDVGCNIGEITLEIKKIFNLDNANCIDVESFSGKKIEPLKGIKHITYDGINIPFEDNTFNFVTLLQVLHHVEKLNKFMKSLNKVMKIGGVIILREHDCYDDEFADLVDVEHMIWAVYDGTDYKTFYDNSYSKYFSRKELVQLFSKYGFKQCFTKSNFHKTHGATNYYYITFIKTDNYHKMERLKRKNSKKKSK
jgi:ubiquinone/menaquinone biosynthesis C-methylase UbiE